MNAPTLAPTHLPTEEQVAIMAAAKGSRRHLLIRALAGAAKTTTLTMIARQFGGKPTLCIAFNKSAAKAMADKMPSGVDSKTLNSVGHNVWYGTIGKKLIVEPGKTRMILKDCIDSVRNAARGEIWEVAPEITQLVQVMKQRGFNPTTRGRSLCTIADVVADPKLEDEPSQWIISMAKDILTKSIDKSFDGLIDYDDQIYMSTLFGGGFPKYPEVMTDESQDFSPLNHEFINRLVTDYSRLIAVGDEHQSIYGFRGAASDSMDRLQTTFNMDQLGLSTSFRCPSAIVMEAQAHAPHMRWHREGGQVSRLETWGLSSVPDGAVIICRNNAPLFKAAMSFIKNGRGVELAGSDIGPGLLRTLKKLGGNNQDMSQAELLEAIDDWQREKVAKGRQVASAIDKAECLKVFAYNGKDLGQALAYAEHLFKAKGPIQLMSGHKAKGQEFERVYHLDSWRIPSTYAKTDDEKKQEANVSYVVTTRSKDQLTYINSETFES